MKFEIGNKQNKGFLDGIEEIYKETEVAEVSSKENVEVDDLDFLENAANEDINFLSGIEDIN